MTALKPPFSEKSIGTLLIALAGPFIWALHFAAVYGLRHIVCATLADSRAGFWAQAVIIAVTVIALLALLLPIVKSDRVLRMDRDGVTPKETRAFLTGVMQLLALLSFVGVLWAGSAALFLPACKSLV